MIMVTSSFLKSSVFVTDQTEGPNRRNKAAFSNFFGVVPGTLSRANSFKF